MRPRVESVSPVARKRPHCHSALPIIVQQVAVPPPVVKVRRYHERGDTLLAETVTAIARNIWCHSSTDLSGNLSKDCPIPIHFQTTHHSLPPLSTQRETLACGWCCMHERQADSALLKLNRVHVHTARLLLGPASRPFAPGSNLSGGIKVFI